MQVRVSQGESKRFDENTCLGELRALGHHARGRAVRTEIAVTFEIDADGILKVRARDVADRPRDDGTHAAGRRARRRRSDIDAMQARQAAHPLAPLEPPRTG